MKQRLYFPMLAALVLVCSACAALRTDGANSTTNSNAVPQTGDASTVAAEGGGAGVVSTSSRSGIAGRPTDGTVATGATPSGTNNGNFNSAQGPPSMGTANSTSSGISRQGPPSPDVKLTANDARQFMQQAIISGVSEVQLSRIAAKSSQRTAVRELAAMIISEHGKTNKELREMAARQQISLPSQEAIQGTADLRTKAEKLQAAGGSGFDNVYLDIMIEDHNAAVKLFEQGTASTSPIIKAFATKTLPALKMHLEKAQSLKK